MKSILTLLVIGILHINCFAQQLSPIHLSYEVKKISDKIYELMIKATMNDGWHVYSQNQPKNAIAQPTKIVFSKNPLLIFIGKPKEIGKKEFFENKEVDISAWQYGDSVTFVQIVTLKAKIKTTINGTITYQTCTEERCLPPKTESFKIELK